MLEGAGSPAEINLRDRDIVNMGMAEMAQCPVILVADIDRGGVFAAIYGTLALLQPQERARVKGVIINKFRGDVALLRSGIEQIEALTGVPVLGVMPWLDVDLEDEDGVALQAGKYHRTDRRDIDIAVVHLPHIANFTDFNALGGTARRPGALCPRSAGAGRRRLVILPGSKNTLGDLCWLRESGMAHAVEQARQRKVPLLGICGGYQMLGETIIDEVESGLGAQPGLGVLKTVTHFAQHKTTTQCRRPSGSALPDWLADAAGLRVSGYEIHMGETRREAGCPPLLQLHKAGQAVDDGAISDDGPGVRHLSPWPVRQRCLYPGAAQRPAPEQRAGAAGQRHWSMPAIKPGSLIGWPRPCANISPSIKFTPSCANIRSPYADSGYRRRAQRQKSPCRGADCRCAAGVIYRHLANL